MEQFVNYSNKHIQNIEKEDESDDIKYSFEVSNNENSIFEDEYDDIEYSFKNNNNENSIFEDKYSFKDDNNENNTQIIEEEPDNIKYPLKEYKTLFSLPDRLNIIEERTNKLKEVQDYIKELDTLYKTIERHGLNLNGNYGIYLNIYAQKVKLPYPVIIGTMRHEVKKNTTLKELVSNMSKKYYISKNYKIYVNDLHLYDNTNENSTMEELSINETCYFEIFNL